MKTIIKKGAILTAIVASSITASNAQMTLTGQVMPRAEMKHGFKSLVSGSNNLSAFTGQRSRLNFGYTNEKLKTGISIQDVRIWGSQSQLNKTDGLTSMHEAWGEVLLNKNFSAKFGRQELVYDDHRIFGNVDWALQARSHDLALFKYADSSFTAHVGIAYNALSNTDDSLKFVPYVGVNNYKDMQFLWLNKKINNLSVSFLFLNYGLQYAKNLTNGVKEYSIKHTQTVGPRIEYKKDKLNAAGYFYYQMGEDNTLGTKGELKTVNAYDASAEVSYKIMDKLTATAGFELLSGTSQTDTTVKNNEMNSFNPYFGTNHKFNGYMDYFYVGNHAKSVGLQDIYVKLKYKADKYFAAADVHLFSAAADIRDVSQKGFVAMSKSLGTELDLTFGYTFSDAVTLQAGYSQMFATKSMEALKGGDASRTNNWAYGMLVFKPNFLK